MEVHTAGGGGDRFLERVGGFQKEKTISKSDREANAGAPPAAEATGSRR